MNIIAYLFPASNAPVQQWAIPWTPRQWRRSQVTRMQDFVFQEQNSFQNIQNFSLKRSLWKIPIKTFKTFHSKEVFERWMIALYCLRQISFKTFTLGLSWKLLRNFYSWKMNDCTVLFEAQGWGRARRVWDVPKWTLPWTCWLPQVFYKKTKDFHLNPDIFCTFYSWGLIRESGPKFD